MITWARLSVAWYAHWLSSLILRSNNSRRLYATLKVTVSRMLCDITTACFTTYLRMSHIYHIPQLANFIAPPCDMVCCVTGVKLVCCSSDLDFNSENSGSNRGWDTGYLRSSWFSSAQVKSRVPPWLSHGPFLARPCLFIFHLSFNHRHYSVVWATDTVAVCVRTYVCVCVCVCVCALWHS